MKDFEKVLAELQERKDRSAWAKGVTAYAVELVEEITDAAKRGWIDLEELDTRRNLEEALLDGAKDWKEYSWGGCSLIFDCDIARRLCTKSEMKKTDNGRRRPNGTEEWLDVQARALWQASNLICTIAFERGVA